MSIKIDGDQVLSKIDFEVYNDANTIEQLSSSSGSPIELPRFRKAVYLSSIVAAVGGFLYGYEGGSMSGIVSMPIFQARFFTEDNMTYLQGLLLALNVTANALGAFASGFLCDRFSRKYSIIVASAILSIGILIQIIGTNFGVLLAGKMLGGFGVGLMTNAIPLYQSEIAPPDIRGRLISFVALMTCVGQLIGYFVTFGTSYVSSDWCWRGPLLLYLIVGAVFGGIVATLPFSPRWLIDKGRYEEAKVVLMGLHQVPGNHPLVVDEYKAISSEIELERSLGERTYLELFQGHNRKRTIISLFILISSPLTGYVTMYYYAPQIILSTGIGDVSASIAATGGTGIVAIIFSFLSLQFCIDKWGRRPVLLIGAACMSISLFFAGVMFNVFSIVNTENSTVTISNPYARNTIIAMIYIFTGSFQFSLGLVTYVYPSEVFNMRTRAKGLALSFGLSWITMIFITYYTPLFIAKTISGVFYFSGSCCVICFIGSCFIPETKGKTLEEMEYIFGANITSYF